MREWLLRGYTVEQLNSVEELLWDECRLQREAIAAPRIRQLRQLYPAMYAPVNPGLQIVQRPPTLADKLSASLRGETPERPAPTLTARIQAALRS